MDATEACDVSIAHSMVVMARWSASRVVEDDDVVIVTGNTRFPTPYVNAIFPKSAVSADTLLERAEAAFSDRRYMLWARGRGPFVKERGAEAGHMVLPDIPGMVVEARVLPPPPPLPAMDARLLSNDDTRGFGELVEVLGASYAEVGLPPKIATALFGEASVALPDAQFALARVDGKPGAAALSITDPATGVGGIYWVGTTPEARRRGAADAATRLVTNAAFDRGAKVVTLQASPTGALVYARMGYREVCRYERTLSPPRK